MLFLLLRTRTVISSATSTGRFPSVPSESNSAICAQLTKKETWNVVFYVTCHCDTHLDYSRLVCINHYCIVTNNADMNEIHCDSKGA